MTDGEPLSVLVVGSGAREHVLVWALSRSPLNPTVWAAPGNPGIGALAEIVDLAVTDVGAIADWAEAHRMDLVIIGPEAPLALGLADVLRARSIAVFGPDRAAAELEWSKAFAKDFMRRHSIPTADYAVFTESSAALEYARHADYPLVVKANGLAAGKGVLICSSPAEAEAAIRSILDERAFGAAGDSIVIEECLQGEELSVIALVDGERFAVLPLARDYKRLQDGNRGPNTGGMGSYAPVDDITPDVLGIIQETILEPAVAGLRMEGRPYRGALYAGLMLTPSGPSVLEFNCRFGDPETQVIVPLLNGDLAALLLDCAEGRLDPDAVHITSGAAVCVVLAADGYPESPRRGDAISGIDSAAEAGALVFQAGTTLHDGQLVSEGGRVLSVVATGSDLLEARDRAYAAAEHIQFSGVQMRRDIALSPALVPA